MESLGNTDQDPNAQDHWIQFTPARPMTRKGFAILLIGMAIVWSLMLYWVYQLGVQKDGHGFGFGFWIVLGLGLMMVASAYVKVRFPDDESNG